MGVWRQKLSWRRAAVALTASALATLLVLVARPYPEERFDPEPHTSTRVFDRHGELLYEQRSASGHYGRPVALDDISEHLVAATLSSEDARFYDHVGIDPRGVARAIYLNLAEGRLAYGGSTVSQQLAGLLDPQPRSLRGKAVESIDALRLERRLDKRQILELYLNRVYYGRLAVGAEAAAQRYFGKPAKQLSLAEGSLLAVLPRGPVFYDPDKHPERALKRRRHILQTMASRGWISHEEAESAASEPLRFVPRRVQRRAPHALDHLDVSSQSKVTTSLDLRLQQAIERRAREHLQQLKRFDVDQIGVVVIDNQSREVLALVGSRDYGQAELAGANNGALARRSPGSTLKPFVYALALERGANLQTELLDAPTSFAGYAPRSANGSYHGPVSLAEALGSSLNVPAVATAEQVGAEAVRDKLAALKLIGSDEEASLALALGGTSVRLVDLTNAYATLARGGVHRPWTLTHRPHPNPEQSPTGDRLFSERAAKLVTHALSSTHARRRAFGFETPFDDTGFAAKTGTSQSFCDSWAIGYDSRFSVGVWVGNFDGRPMHGLTGMTGAAPLLRDVTLLLEDHEPPVTAVESGEAPGPTSCVAAGATADAASSAEARAACSPQISPSLLHEAHGRLRSPIAGATYVVDELAALDSQGIPLTVDLPPGATAVRLEMGTGSSRRQIVSFEAESRVEESWPLREALTHCPKLGRCELRLRAVFIDSQGRALGSTDPASFVIETPRKAREP